LNLKRRRNHGILARYEVLVFQRYRLAWSEGAPEKEAPAEGGTSAGCGR